MSWVFGAWVLVRWRVEWLLTGFVSFYLLCFLMSYSELLSPLPLFSPTTQKTTNPTFLHFYSLLFPPSSPPSSSYHLPILFQHHHVPSFPLFIFPLPSPPTSSPSPLPLSPLSYHPSHLSNILEQLTTNPHIVRYHERFVDKPSSMLYILMEYCSGGDLSSLILRNCRSNTLLPEEIIWSYLAQLTLGLHDCHLGDEKGRGVILHRDIKPENVFLDKDNLLKLGDFGLSKALGGVEMTRTYVGVRCVLRSLFLSSLGVN